MKIISNEIYEKLVELSKETLRHNTAWSYMRSGKISLSREILLDIIEQNKKNNNDKS